MAELDAAFAPAERTGPPGGRYANELFTADAGEMTVYRPVREPRAVGRIEVVELPAVELAVTVHSGSHDDIGVTYGRLGAWVVEHALGRGGAGPRDVPGRAPRHRRARASGVRKSAGRSSGSPRRAGEDARRRPDHLAGLVCAIPSRVNRHDLRGQSGTKVVFSPEVISQSVP